MNVVDYVLIGIVLISVLFGIYRGFITSLLGLLAVFASMFAAYALGPVMADWILKSETVVNTLAHYSDAASRLGDLETSQLAVSQLDASAIEAILLTEPVVKKKVTFKVDRIAPYFPRGTNPEEMEAVILKLLANWQRNREMRKAQESGER